jgi:hypothetical protein
LYRLAALLLVAVFVAQGCSGGGPPPPAAQRNVEEVATWYNMYRSSSPGRTPPPSEEAFVAFINKTMKEKQGITEGMRSDFLVSPRDGKKFNIRYGKPQSSSADKNIVVWEQDGHDGKKWYATEQGYGLEVDDATLQQLLAQK